MGHLIYDGTDSKPGVSRGSSKCSRGNSLRRQRDIDNNRSYWGPLVQQAGPICHRQGVVEFYEVPPLVIGQLGATRSRCTSFPTHRRACSRCVLRGTCAGVKCYHISSYVPDTVVLRADKSGKHGAADQTHQPQRAQMNTKEERTIGNVEAVTHSARRTIAWIPLKPTSNLCAPCALCGQLIVVLSLSVKNRLFSAIFPRFPRFLPAFALPRAGRAIFRRAEFRGETASCRILSRIVRGKCFSCRLSTRTARQAPSHNAPPARCRGAGAWHVARCKLLPSTGLCICASFVNVRTRGACAPVVRCRAKSRVPARLRRPTTSLRPQRACLGR